MNKFEDSLKQAQPTVVPSAHFVDNVMEHVMPAKDPFWKRIIHYAPLLLGAAAAVTLVVLIIITPSMRSTDRQVINPLTATQTRSVAKAPVQQSETNSTNPAPQSAKTAVIPSGTDDATLAGSLNTVQSALNQEAVDEAAATTAINQMSNDTQ